MFCRCYCDFESSSFPGWPGLAPSEVSWIFPWRSHVGDADPACSGQKILITSHESTESNDDSKLPPHGHQWHSPKAHEKLEINQLVRSMKSAKLFMTRLLRQGVERWRRPVIETFFKQQAWHRRSGRCDSRIKVRRTQEIKADYRWRPRSCVSGKMLSFRIQRVLYRALHGLR